MSPDLVPSLVLSFSPFFVFLHCCCAGKEWPLFVISACICTICHVISHSEWFLIQMLELTIWFILVNDMLTDMIQTDSWKYLCSFLCDYYSSAISMNACWRINFVTEFWITPVMPSPQHSRSTHSQLTFGYMSKFSRD